jgi:aminoglycoside 6'-N-acetyltransferase I
MAVADVVAASGTGAEVWQPAGRLETVVASLEDDTISRVAYDRRAASWAGSAPSPRRRVGVEIHPLVVHRDCQGRGIGRALVADLEVQVRERGGMTVCLGTDDENGRTSIGGTDLYPDPLAAATTLRSHGSHPFEFYRKLGYAVVGVLPDANGYGKPDIFMAKRVGVVPTGDAAADAPVEALTAS